MKTKQTDERFVAAVTKCNERTKIENEAHDKALADQGVDAVYAVHPTERLEVIKIEIGAMGYWPVCTMPDERAAEVKAAYLNGWSITTAEIESAIAGSMFGWHCPAAKLALSLQVSK